MAGPALGAQQVLLDAMLDGVANLILQGTNYCPANYEEPTGAGPTPLDPSKIVEYMGDDRPPIEGQQFFVYRIAEFIPDLNAGAGQLASTGKLVIEIRLWTRFGVDQSGWTKALFRAQSRGHWLRMFQIINAFQNNVLNTAYDDNLRPSGTTLSWTPMQMRTGTFAKLEMGTKNPTWAFTAIEFEIDWSMSILQPGT